MEKIKKITSWYNTKTKRQINVLRISAILIMAIPIVGWFLIAPWLIPLMLYLEFNYNPNEE
jgi:hypothetical protein